MQGSVLEKLFFSIGIIDKITKPSKVMSKALMDIQHKARTGFTDIGKGALTITGTATALNAFTTPARGFTKALKEIEALEVPAAELDKLGIYSKKAAAHFGINAENIVRSGYDIQNSIAGLGNGELAKFTYNSAMPDKATKSDAIEKNYFSIELIDKLTGPSNKVSKLLLKIQEAAELSFMSLSKEVGIIGAVGYKLVKATNATKGFGMALNDITSLVTSQEELDKLGFSAKNAAINFGMSAADIVKAGYDIQSSIKGLDNGELAKLTYNSTILSQTIKFDIGTITTYISIWEFLVLKLRLARAALWKLNIINGNMTRTQQIAAVWNYLYAKSLGTSALWAKICSGAVWVYNTVTKSGVFWTNLSALATSIWTGSLSAATVQAKLSAAANIIWNKGLASSVFWTKALNVVTFLLKFAFSALKLTILLGTVPAVLLAKGVFVAFQLIVAGVTKVIQFLRLNLLWNKTVVIASAIWTKVLAAAQWLMNTSLWAGCAAVWSFTVALLACPITWIVVGIGLLIGAIVALIYYWDEVTGFVMKYGEYLLMLSGPIGMVAGLIIHFWDDIIAAAEWCFDKITGWLSGIWDFGKNIVSAILGWVINKITGFLGWMTNLPIIGGKIQSGLDALKEYAGVEINQTAQVERPVVPTVQRQRSNDIPAGGIRSTSNNRTTNYGGVTFNVANPVGPGDMEDMWLLQA